MDKVRLSNTMGNKTKDKETTTFQENVLDRENLGKKIGHTLIQEGLITKKQLELGLKKQNALRGKRLGEIFIRDGMATPSDISKALKTQESQAEQKLGVILTASGIISSRELSQALDKQKKDRNKRIGEILIEMEVIDSEVLALALALQQKLPYVDLESYPIDELAVHAVSPELARRLKVFPFQFIKKELTVAFSNPRAYEAERDLSFHTGLNIRPAIASERSIKKAIVKHYEMEEDEELTQLLLEAESADVEEIRDIDKQEYNITEKVGKEEPIIALVNHILKTAVVKQASDIHIFPEAKKVHVKLRIDGVLHDELVLPIDRLPSIATRMKILSNMNIAERRLPQDGRAKIKVHRKVIDLRFSCLPTVFGESIVIRVLDRESGLVSLSNMGFLDTELKKLRDCIHRPHGMLLFTGPTGSGKSTSIYGCLQEPVFSQRNAITLENPVEYELPGMCQVQMKEHIGLTFARGLRQILRHDPDVIVVGEIRDTETAKIAVQAALTGHLLISTLHTNTAAGAFFRLADMGVEPFLVTSSILGVISQNLIRKVCTHCREADLEGREKLRLAHFPLEPSEDAVFYKGKGCEECNGTGYKGRTIVYEFLTINEDIKRAIIKGESSSQIRGMAIENGMRTIEEIAYMKALEGITSVDEIIPIISETVSLKTSQKRSESKE
ncbi:MAG: ATPase, T2SS/T4P/T4SS family [Thermodesulfobacteriota bacterium]|nr:ATPase, T2SS/T4P/T4SS family [Thermodesulfobacteriota bacterium]